MKIKVDIYSGFLGAGKTRLIKKLIEEKFYNETIAIVENEFGEVSIDGQILNDSQITIKEINQGCICCELKGDFSKSLIELVNEVKPQKIIVEPTGIAKLSDILSRFEEIELKDLFQIDKIVTVVDPTKYDKYLKNFRTFFIDQMKNANYIVLSRCQFLSADKEKEIVEKIRIINKNSYIVSKPWNEISGRDIFSQLGKNEGLGKVKININKPSLLNNTAITKSIENKDNIKFDTFAIDLKYRISKEELMSKFEFLRKSEYYGTIIRAKGIVETSDGMKKQFHLTLDEFSMDIINYSGNPVISFIGINLNKNEIEKFFSKGV